MTLKRDWHETLTKVYAEILWPAGVASRVDPVALPTFRKWPKQRPPHQ